MTAPGWPERHPVHAPTPPELAGISGNTRTAFQPWRCATHSSFALLCIQSGTFRLRQGHQQKVLHPGSVVFQGPATPFSCRRVEWGSRGYRIHLATSLVLPLLEGLRPALAEDVSRGIPTAPIARFCPPRPYLRLRILQGREARDLPWDPALLETTAQEILKAVLVTPRRTPLPPRQRRTRSLHRRWVRQAKTLLAQQYAEDLRIADIAEAVGASPYHLSRIFKRVAGISPHQYRIRLRLAVSLEQLVQGETDLGRLAAAVGFSSHSHFTRAFSAEFGMSPKDVRQWLNEPGELTRLPGVLPVPSVCPAL